MQTQSIIRRLGDIGISLAAMPLVLPATAIAWVVTKGSPFYRQVRVGLNGKEFIILKYDTMKNDENLSFRERTTRASRLVRAAGINEWPQFFNILKGDMSLIGPRPRTIYDHRVGQTLIGTDRWSLRYQILPGLIPPTVIQEKLLGQGYTNPAETLEIELDYIGKKKSGRALGRDIQLACAAAVAVFTLRADPQSKIPKPSVPGRHLSPSSVDKPWRI